MENLKSLIKIKLLEKKWSERHFIKDVLQMPMSSYYDFLKAKNPRIDVLKNISAALEIPLSSLLNETDNVNSQEPSIPYTQADKINEIYRMIKEMYDKQNAPKIKK